MWGLLFGGGVLADLGVALLAQCPREGCDGSHAFFYQVQIRSADEPMTTFLKVGCSCGWNGCGADTEVVYDMWSAMEGELSDALPGDGQLQSSYQAGVWARMELAQTKITLPLGFCTVRLSPKRSSPVKILTRGLAHHTIIHASSPFRSISSSYTRLRVYMYGRNAHLKPFHFGLVKKSLR